jgi:hypothetical protein
MGDSEDANDRGEIDARDRPAERRRQADVSDVLLVPVSGNDRAYVMAGLL